MVSDTRFDLERARAEARAEKLARKRKAIASNVVFVAVLLAAAVGAKLGWDKWQAHCRDVERREEYERQKEERAREAEAKRRADDAARAAAARAQAEADRKAEAERREAERLEREAKKEAEKKAREEARAKAEEDRRRAEEDKAEQEALKHYAERMIASVNLNPADHVVVERELDAFVDVAVEERRWNELVAAAEARTALNFLELLDSGELPVNSDYTRYPDRDSVRKIIAKLADERFTALVRAANVPRGQRVVLVELDPKAGFVEAKGSRKVQQGGRDAGWTVQFVHGAPTPLFVMKSSTADRFTREWSALRRKKAKLAEKLVNRDAFVAGEMVRSAPDFAKSVKVELRMEPQVEDAVLKEDPKEASRRKTERLERIGLKGTGSMRTLRGPGGR